MKRTIIVTSILAALLLFAISTTREVRLSRPVSAQAQVTTGCAVPSFAAMETVTAGAKPVAATTGDFNQDGKLDAVVANYDAGNISIYLGDGGGGLASPVNFSAGIRPVAVAKADFNRDGKMDLVITNSGSNNITILLNSPGMKFYPVVIIATGLSPRLTVVGDFNRDGKADLATANAGSDNIPFFLGNGNAAFGSAVNFATGPQPVSENASTAATCDVPLSVSLQSGRRPGGPSRMRKVLWDLRMGISPSARPIETRSQRVQARNWIQTCNIDFVHAP